MSVTILAPYAPHETTAAAIRLADLANLRGVPVKLVATEKPRQRVHSYWDSRILSPAKSGIYRHCKGADLVIHFGTGETLKKAKLTAEKAEHVLVPLWHGLDARHHEIVREFDLVVCAGQASFDTINARFFGGKGDAKKKLTWCRWDSGLPALRRPAPTVPDRVRALVWCDRYVIDCGMAPILEIGLSTVLDNCPNLDLTIVSTKSWAQSDLKAIKQLARRWQGRVVLKRAGDLLTQARDFVTHDWMLYPAVRGEFGLAVNRSLSCGSPVVCFALPPFNEHVFDRHNGVLIPCELQGRRGGLKAPTAVPTLAKFVEVCSKAFEGPRPSTILKQHSWNLDNHQKAFENAWCALWA